MFLSRERQFPQFIILFCSNRKFDVYCSQYIIIMHQYCRPMPLKERNSFRLQNLVNVTLSIDVALHNNEICFLSAHNATPYHNTPTSKSVPPNETIISKTFPSSSKNSNSTVMVTKVKPRLIRE